MTRCQTSLIGALLASAVLVAPAQAQQADESEQGETDAQDNGRIVVTADRLRGQLLVDEAPVVELSSEDIDALGVGSIQDLLAVVEPATGSTSGRGGGGRPVFLINGIRVSSFREFFRYPSEAIAKFEVFPEETAQRFGFSPDRRVVNIILKDDYSSITGELEFEGPSRGGYSRNEQELTYFQVASGGRLNVNVEVNDTSALTEAERDLTPVGLPEESEFRTLIADSFGFEGSANYVRAFVESGSSLSLTLSGEYNESASLSGLRDFVTLDPLERYTETDQLAFAGNYSQQFGAFRLTSSFNASRDQTRQRIERLSDGEFDRAQSTVWSGSNLNTLRGIIAQLPGGEVSTTFDLGYVRTQIDSKDTRGGGPVSLGRGDLSAGASISVPITSRRTGFLDTIGSISVNGQIGVNDLSDFGTLMDWTLGMNWAPTDALSFSASRVWREAAPGLGALGSPTTSNFNVPVFDFATGQNTLVTVTFGGNPNLLRETQADWQFGANWKLPFWDDARLRVDYALNNSDDVTLASPSYSAAFEQAFPERITRDAGGQLLAIDRRPVTLFETKSRTLTFGLNARGTIGKRPERGSAGGDPPAQQTAAVREGRNGARGQGGFAAMREKFCATPEGETPDLSALPPRMAERLRGEDGNVDPERFAEARKRLCGEGGEERTGRFAAMRGAICADPPNITALPERMRQRLTREDGTIDPERLASARERFCSENERAESGASEGSDNRQSRRGSGGPRLPFGGRGDDPRPRYFLSLSHTLLLENEVTLAPGGPVFDQLDGEVLSGGAISKNSSQLQAGLFWNGYGMRLSGRYTGKAMLLGNGVSGNSDLFFSDLATFNLRLFADLGRVLKKDEGFWKGARISFRADNIFDARRQITDSNGDTPLSFEPLRLDPTGRYLGVQLRKQF